MMKRLKIRAELQEGKAKHFVSAGSIAAIYAGLGDKDKPCEWLEKSFEEHESLPNIRTAPALEKVGITSDPRFANLLRRMSVPRVKPRAGD